jgi:hypothetical protein
MCSSWFETFSQSKEGTDYAPFLVSAPQGVTFEKIRKWSETKNFKEVKPNKDFFEFFIVDGEFEITIAVTVESNKSLVNMSVYGKRGKTRKKLKEHLSALITYIKSC